jgi:hypothetical protein
MWTPPLFHFDKKNQRIEAMFRFCFDPNGMLKLRWLSPTTFTSYNPCTGMASWLPSLLQEYRAKEAL